MLKTLKLPTAEEFETSFDEVQKGATSVGYEESDVDDIIKSARRNKKNEISGLLGLRPWKLFVIEKYGNI